MGISVAGEVRWMAFSSSGSHLAIHDEIGVTVYGYPQGNIVFKLTERPVIRCAYSPDGRLLAWEGYKEPDGPFGKIKLQSFHIWDIIRNKQICYVEFPRDYGSATLCCVKFSPDSTKLAIVCADGLVSVIRVATGQAVHIESPRKRHYLSLPSCAFFPGSDGLVYTYLTEAIKIADLNAGCTVLSLDLNTQLSAPGGGELIGFRPFDQKLLVAFYGKDDYDNRIDAVDARNGARVPFISGKRGYMWSPSNIVLSPRGDYLAAHVLKEVRSFILVQRLYVVAVWDGRTGQVISETTIDKSTTRPMVHSVFSLAFAPTGNLLVGRRDSIEQVAIH